MDQYEILERQIDYERFLLHTFRDRLAACPPGYLRYKTDRKGRGEYYHKLPDDPTPRYLNRHMSPLIRELKYKRLLQEAIRRLELNLRGREKYRKACLPTDFDSINASLPPAYRSADVPTEDKDLWQKNGQFFTQSENPYHRERLIYPTTFGLMTRSRGEAYIAEILHANQFSFHYEKKLFLLDDDGTQKIRYPDFTLPMIPEYNFFIENKGMYQNDEYRQRDEETMRLYHLNGIYPPKNLLIFMDGPNGEFHADSILQTIQGILIPLRTLLTSQNPPARR